MDNTTNELAVITPEVTDLTAPAAEETAVAPVRTLNFTVVRGNLRGEHGCPFELHATGCRDLRSKLAQNLESFNVYAPDRESAHADGAEQANVELSKIWVQPCCQLKRMQAIGRA